METFFTVAFVLALIVGIAGGVAEYRKRRAAGEEPVEIPHHLARWLDPAIAEAVYVVAYLRGVKEPLTPWAHLAYVLFLASVLTLWVPLAGIPWKQRRAGAVLFDLGRPPKQVALYLVLLLLIAACAGLPSLLLYEFGWDVIGVALCVIAYGCSSVLFLLAGILLKCQVSTGGIWAFPTFAPWEKIQSYQWDKDLVLKVKQGAYLFNLRISCTHTEALDVLLAQHVVPAPSVQQ